MTRAEIEKFRLKGVEDEPADRRFMIILDDSWANQDMWLKVFGETDNLRCVVPGFDENWVDDLCRKIDLTRVDLVVIDWFLDNWWLNETGQEFLGKFRKVNPQAFVVETSAMRPRGGERVYRGSNISCCIFQIFLDRELDPIKNCKENTIRAKLYALQNLLVPAFEARRRLEENLETVTDYELDKDMEVVMSDEGIMVILENLKISGDELRERFGQLDINGKIDCLHCAFDIEGNVSMKKDEMFYTMALFRMKLILGLGD